ncbi:hypothetical protein HZS_2873 [Henneguya salminicola]|nr:hypothetical protein HZS_2873 [Henneguya salminicola]
MDFSKTMEDDLESLKTLAVHLGNNFLNSTNNRIGMGIFVDKPIIPFAHSTPQKCCIPTFSFQNILPLGENAEKLKEILESLKISTNIDTQEGTLDAIHQTAACEENIGWRTIGQSRRLILVATDGRIKIQGDSRVIKNFSQKIAGIFRPHDGKCHLNASNYYDKDLYFDYVSLNMVKTVLMNNRISVLFAATKDVRDDFVKISKLWNGVNSDTLLSHISLSIEKNDYFANTYNAICGNSKITNLSVNTCMGIKMGDTVTFNITLKAIKCSSKNLKNQRLNFNINGLSDVIVYFEIKCGCDCTLSNKSDVSV